MSFPFTCPYCRTEMKLEDMFKGTKTYCRDCGIAISVPEPIKQNRSRIRPRLSLLARKWTEQPPPPRPRPSRFARGSDWRAEESSAPREDDLLILILGLLGLFVLPLFAIVAVSKGQSGQTGYTLGWITLMLWGISLGVALILFGAGWLK